MAPINPTAIKKIKNITTKLPRPITVSCIILFISLLESDNLARLSIPIVNRIAMIIVNITKNINTIRARYDIPVLFDGNA